MSSAYKNVNYPYITLTLFDKNNTSLTCSGNPARPDYFQSLKHTRYIDQANTATVSLSYAPKFGEDPCKLERAIVGCFGRCTFEYGMEGHRSRVYRGVIYDYDVSLNNGSLSYTLHIFSQAVTYNETYVQASVKQTYKGRYLRTLSSVVGPKVQIRRPHDSITEVTNTPFRTLEWMSHIVEYYLQGSYEFDIEGSSQGFKVPNTYIDIAGKSALEGLREVASMLVDDEEPYKHFYKIEVDDSGKWDDSSLPKIRLVRTNDITHVEKRLSFEWGSKDTNVLEFSPSYQGIFLLASHKGSVGGQDTENLVTHNYNYNYTCTKDGAITGLKIDRPEYNQVFNGEERWLPSDTNSVISATLKDVNWFEEHKGYPFNATLTVLGVDDVEKPLRLGFSVIEVLPYVNGSLYETFKGLYTVIGIEDSIDSKGFTTKYTLYKSIGVDAELEGKDGRIHYYVEDEKGNKYEIEDYILSAEGYKDKGVAPDIPASSGSSGSTGDGAGSYRDQVWNHLFSKLLTLDKTSNRTKAAKVTAAIMGNMAHESINFNPTTVEIGKSNLSDEEYTAYCNLFKGRSAFIDNEVGYGLCQWTTSSRKSALWNYAHSTDNGSIGDLATQVNFLVKELQGDYNKVYIEMTTTDDLKKMTTIFLDKFEHPEDWESKIDERSASAQAIYRYYFLNTPKYVYGGPQLANEYM